MVEKVRDQDFTICVIPLQYTCCKKWVTGGNDLTAMLPMLSTYMGHKSVSATSRYLRLTAEVYPELLSTIEEKCAFVIPEVQNEEI